MDREEYIGILEVEKAELKKENRQLRKVIDTINKICKSIPYTWSVCDIEVVNKIEKALKEVE